ncbi:MAG: hypothetical protein WAM30_15140 [Candidatus Dormiibacterota bacterium]
MALALLRLPVRWVQVRLGICLASLDNAELLRFALRQRRWGLLGSMASFPLYVIGGTAWGFGADLLYLALWVPGALLSTAALMIGLYSRATLASALFDRSSTPIAVKGRVRILLTGREGGWPMLLHDQDGRHYWLTGRAADLDRIRTALERRRSGVDLAVTVTLTYFPRTRVIDRVEGLSVEERERMRVGVGQLSPVPT